MSKQVRNRPASKARTSSAAAAQPAGGRQARPGSAAADSLDRRAARYDSPVVQAFVVAAIAAAVAAVRWSPSMGLGDAPEFTAAVRTVGIAHPPGYPAYVLLGRLFTLIEPFGSIAARVNLFSLACTAAAAGVLHVASRRLGLSALGAGAVALLFATSTSVWWNAGFAKPYALTSLLLALLLLAAARWRDEGGWAPVVGFGIVLGIGSGSNYQSVLLAMPGVAVMLFTGRRRPRFSELVAAVGAASIFTLGLLGWEVVRAATHPLFDWGNPTNLPRLVDVIRMKDFGFGGHSALSSSSKRTRTGSMVHHGAFTWVGNIRDWPLQVVGEMSLLAVPPVLLGIWASVRPAPAPAGRRWDALRRWAFLPVLLFTTLLGGAVVTNLRPSTSPGAVVAFGAFLEPALLALCFWGGLGIDELGTWVVRRSQRATEPARPSRPVEPAGRPPRWALVVAPAVAVLIVATSVVVHWGRAAHTPTDVADAYGSAVLSTLPPHAILAVFGAEFSFPIIDRQVLDGQRRDVTVVELDLLGTSWYRPQLNRQLGVKVPVTKDVLTLLEQLPGRLGDRPLFVDGVAARGLAGHVGLLQQGLAWKVTLGQSTTLVDTEATATVFDSGALPDLAAPGARAWPDVPIDTVFRYGLISYANALAALKLYPRAETAYRLALSWGPGDAQVSGALATVQQLERQPATPTTPATSP